MGIVQEGKIFTDRRDAGFEVGKLLEHQYKDKNVLVLGIPRGGIVIAYEVAKVLHGELSVVITKKLPHPLQQEFAIGATAEDGSVFLTSSARDLSSAIIQRIVKAQSEEIKSRVQRFRKGKPLPEMTNRIVIIADDGIATGATIVPAIKLCKGRRAARVIVAAPVSGENYASEINSLADEIVIAGQPDNFYSVGQVYDDFHHLSDEEVVFLLEDFEKENK
jgi:putative phosphoribosyl transferase